MAAPRKQTQKKKPAQDPTAAMHADVDALASPTQPGDPIELNGHVFRPRRLKVRQITPFLAKARPIIAALTSSPDAANGGPALPPDAPADGQGGNPDPASIQSMYLARMSEFDWIMGIAQDHLQTVLEALAIAMEPDQDQHAQESFIERLEDLDVADLLTLVRHVVVLNMDFLKGRGLTVPRFNPDNLPGRPASKP